MREIPLTKGFFAKVDDADFEWLSKFKWYATVQKCAVYAARKPGNSQIMMHRVIMGSPAGLVIDHINHNGLDNTRANLRICTWAENNRNRRPVTKFKGVWKTNSPDRWVAYIRQTFIGSYKSPEDAARAYDLAAVRLFGEFAHLNFPAAREAA